MEFQILGPLEVLDNGRLLDLGGPKQRALLAALLLEPNRVVSEGRLIEALWEDDPPQTARKALQVRISQLRKALGKERLETKFPGYLLCVEEGESDLERFQRLQEQGKQSEALSLWRGPPLADFANLRFAQSEIARLEELRLACTEECIDEDLAEGRHAQLVGELEALVAEHPLRERLRSQLMLSLYRCGRQAEALDVYRQARRLLVEDLGIEPSSELQELHRAILNHDASLMVAREQEPELRSRPSVPVSANRLIGRRSELRAVSDLLLGEARLVTVTGAGGSGKTRLALEVATRLEAEFGQRVYFIPLAPVLQAQLLPTTILAALGVSESASDPPLETLKRSLRSRSLLLVLDNFEHLLQAAPLLAELLAGCPRLKLLVTSRAVLHLSGEHEYPLEPLPLKQAIALFTERSCAVRPDFSGQEPVLAAICTRLDCLPLALELAAARSRLLAPHELLGRLEDKLELLIGGPRDLAPRQQTLRATIEWSHDLLDSQEQRLFARLAIFPGGATLDAAQSVCDADLNTLQSLVEQSLLRRRGERFSMLDTIREYAHAKLHDSGETKQIGRRHAGYFLSLAEAASAGPDWSGPEGVNWDVRLTAEHDNLRAALSFARDVGDKTLLLRLAGALGSRFWWHLGLLREGRWWLEQALAANAASAEARALALAAITAIAHEQNDVAAMLKWGEAEVGLARSRDDPNGLQHGLVALAQAAASQGELDQATRLFSEGLEYARRGSYPIAIAAGVANLGYVTLLKGEYERALALLLEAAEIHSDLGEPWGVAVCQQNAAHAAFELERIAVAADYMRAALRVHRQLARTSRRTTSGVFSALVNAAAITAAIGQPHRAAHIVGAFEALAESGGYTLEPLDESTRAKTLEHLQAELGEALATALVEGRGMSPVEAVDYALTSLATQTPGD
jgi:predicted ATPase/DNA-binding SARP family transcriptional activator